MTKPEVKSEVKREPVDKDDAKETADQMQWDLAPDEFMITVTLEGKSVLGLDVHWDDARTLYIKGIKPGVVKEWNLDKPVEAVKPGDRIIAVNGIADDPQAMLGQCRARGRLKLLIRGQVDRTKTKAAPAKPFFDATLSVPVNDCGPQPPVGPDEQIITLESYGQPLGIDVDWADGRTLYIRSMTPGVIEDWNRSRPPEQAVCPGDAIVAVNGFAGDPPSMVQQCRTSRRLQLLIRGPPQPPATRDAVSTNGLPLSTPLGHDARDRKRDKEKDRTKPRGRSRSRSAQRRSLD